MPAPLDFFINMLEERGITLPTLPTTPAQPTTPTASSNVANVAAQRDVYRQRQREKRLNGVNLYKSPTSALPSIFDRFKEDENDPITKQ